MSIQPYYNTGTASLANGTTSVTLAGGASTATMSVNDTFHANGLVALIGAIPDATHLTLAQPWPGATLNGAAYEVWATPDRATMAQSVRDLLQTLSGGVLQAIASVSSGSLNTALIPIGASNTGLYSPAAGKIGFAVNGANVGTWSQTGLTLASNTTLNLSGATGQIFASPDSPATSPAYAFVGDAGTGLFHAGTNVIGFASGGAERMRISANGNVGIGTAAPGGTLGVNGDAFVQYGSGIGFSPGGGAAYPAKYALQNYFDGAADRLMIQACGLAGSVISFHTGPINGNLRGETLRIDGWGNVGIGTSSPSARLTVQQDAGKPFMDLVDGSAPGFRLRAYNTGSSQTFSDTFNFSLYGDNRENAGIHFYRGGGWYDGWLTFTANGAERMRIDQRGNVGIGTTTPNQYLRANDVVLDVNGLVTAKKYCSNIRYNLANDGSSIILDVMHGCVVVRGVVPYNEFLDLLLRQAYSYPIIIGSSNYGNPPKRSYGIDSQTGNLTIALNGGLSGTYSININQLVPS